MPRLFPFCLCVLLGLAAVAQAEPAAKPSNAPTAQSGAGRVTVPLVLRPVNPPLEYLLTPPVPPGSGPVWRAAQEEVLREAMFRYLIDNTNRQEHFSVCYLSVGTGSGQDPEAALLMRLRGSQPPVQAASAFQSDRKKWTAYRVAAFQWQDDSHVKIEAVASQSNVFSSVYLTLTCTLRNGWWVITGGFEVSA